MEDFNFGAILTGIVASFIVTLFLRYTDNYERVNDCVIRFLFWCFLPSNWNPSERFKKEWKKPRKLKEKNLKSKCTSVLDFEDERNDDILILKQIDFSDKNKSI